MNDCPEVYFGIMANDPNADLSEWKHRRWADAIEVLLPVRFNTLQVYRSRSTGSWKLPGKRLQPIRWSALNSVKNTRMAILYGYVHRQNGLEKRKVTHFFTVSFKTFQI